MGNKREISKRKRKNARLYPIYKMFSWDLLCFYSIEFLFYTKTKGVTASQVLIINAFYVLFKILMQVPAVTIVDMLGRRKGIIIGNILLAIYLVVLIIAPGMIGVIIADFICALGFDMKLIAETNLLYDSVSTNGGEGLYLNLDSKGGSWYHWLNGMVCLTAGYLFVYNNYLPILVCLGFVIVSLVLSFGFKDIYSVKEIEKKNIGQVLKEYSGDLKQAFKFIRNSNRMRSYIIFGAIFYGSIKMIETYRNALLVSKGIPEEQFSMILAVLMFIAGIAVILSKKIHRKFRNKTLTVLSLSHVGACIVIGLVANIAPNELAIPIILLMCIVIRVSSAIWGILEYKYLKNFSTNENRNKITSTYEIIGGIVTSTMAVLASLLLERVGINAAFLIVSLVVLIAIILALDYMRTRMGLKPNEYSKEDLEMEESVTKS